MVATLIEVLKALEPLKPIAFVCGSGLVVAYVVVRWALADILSS
jgi:hypothetical protein